VTEVRNILTVDTPAAQKRRFQLFLATLAGVIVTLPLFLVTTEQFSLRLYYVISFLWFLISSEIFAPSDPKTPWWNRLKWIKLVGWIIFALIIAERFAAIS
jgi:hypothetical protein